MNFRIYSKNLINIAYSNMIEDIERELLELPKIERPKYIPPPKFKWKCLETHTRYGQDIHGKIDFIKDEIVESCHATPEEFKYTVDITKFERIYE